MVEKINKLKSWQVIILIFVIGCVVYSTGLTNPFQGDDYGQIVNNLPVHVIANIKLFFEGGTFYNGGGTNAPLSGIYYRPLMTTAFSVIYSVFGSHTFYFHLFQLIVGIGSAIILYQIFRHFFNTVLSIVLSVIFLVHPINSQNFFSIPNTQDVLFLFFGLLSFWILLKFNAKKSLVFAALSLFLSLLSKEAGVCFLIIDLLYLILWRRKRLPIFSAISAVSAVVWLILKINAVGLDAHSKIAPIDNLNLAGRLATAPSIMQFYITKFIFPINLASAYYWTYPRVSVSRTIVPLLIDALVIGIVACMAYFLRTQRPHMLFKNFVFFSIWAGIGLLPYLQIIPLDFTASTPWFYFSGIGMLGMIGVVCVAFQKNINPGWFLAVSTTIIVVFGVITTRGGFDWKSQYVLARHNTSTSKDNYVADKNIAQHYVDTGNYVQAAAYAQDSVNIYPAYDNYLLLGEAYAGQANYPDAISAFNKGLNYQKSNLLIEDIAAITLLYGKPQSNQEYFTSAVNIFPEDSTLWIYYSLYEYKTGNSVAARGLIEKANTIGPVPGFVYEGILNGDSINIDLSTIGKEVSINASAD